MSHNSFTEGVPDHGFQMVYHGETKFLMDTLNAQKNLYRLQVHGKTHRIIFTSQDNRHILRFVFDDNVLLEIPLTPEQKKWLGNLIDRDTPFHGESRVYGE